MIRSLPRALSLPAPTVSALWLPEPELAFADGVQHIDPKVAIPLAGPRSLGTVRHRSPINLGFIGTGAGVDKVRRFLDSSALGVDGDEDHAPFPGFLPDRGFRTSIQTGDSLVETLTTSEVRSLMEEGKRQRIRFEELLAIVEAKLRRLCNRDAPLDCVVLVLPDDVAKRCGTAKYIENGRLIQRNFHSAFKSAAMQFRMPTQIIWESTTRMGVEQGRRDLDHPSEIAWNLFTGLYFKADGFPWAPVGFSEGTCYVGVGFFHPHGEASTLRASLAQAFSESGDAFVLRGNEFTWEGRWPHLSRDHAASLITATLERYEDEFKRKPRRVVVHKRSWFAPDEKAGFEDALTGVEYDLVALRRTSDVRMMREAQYPPLRGTAFEVGERSYLYTTGTIPELGYYPHGHVPAPLEIAEHVGDTPRRALLEHILLLTKMNWNSARYAEREPVTLRFADLVGGVLREVGPDRVPEAKYSFYM